MVVVCLRYKSSSSIMNVARCDVYMTEETTLTKANTIVSTCFTTYYYIEYFTAMNRLSLLRTLKRPARRARVLTLGVDNVFINATASTPTTSIDFSNINKNNRAFLTTAKRDFKIQEIMLMSPEKELHMHNKKLLGLEQDWARGSLYKFKGKVHVVKSLKDEKFAFESLMKDVETSSVLTQSGKKLFVIGLDTETQPEASKVNPPATLQLSTKNHAIVYHLTHKNFITDGQFPPQLKSILANKEILKVGVEVAVDARELLYSYGVSISSVFDLNRIAPGKETLGLKRMALQYLDQDLEKGKYITCSNWGREELTDLQKVYAAYDASVALEIFNAMMEKDKSLQIEENHIINFAFNPDNFLFTDAHQTIPNKALFIPKCYERSTLGGKKGKQNVGGGGRDVNDNNSAVDNQNIEGELYSADYIAPKTSRYRGREREISDSLIRLYLSYLYKCIVDKKKNNYEPNGLDEEQPVLLIPTFFPPSLRAIFHDIANQNGLYSVSKGSKSRTKNSRMLSIWKSQQSFTKCCEEKKNPIKSET
jgi:ribonuclease D